MPVLSIDKVERLEGEVWTAVGREWGATGRGLEGCG